MNFLADESVDQQIVDRLREDGHFVVYVAEMDPGIDDKDVLYAANQQMALLITADKGFGELVFRQRLVSKGVVLVRLAGLSPAGRRRRIARHPRTRIGAVERVQRCQPWNVQDPPSNLSCIF